MLLHCRYHAVGQFYEHSQEEAQVADRQTRIRYGSETEEQHQLALCAISQRQLQSEGNDARAEERPGGIPDQICQPLTQLSNAAMGASTYDTD